jgi:hypothetical protein
MRRPCLHEKRKAEHGDEAACRDDVTPYMGHIALQAPKISELEE